ncbi:hypothetical protein [Amycolatopsis sp. NPDC001319]|uniref:hypothetical protein n=1 Tax=unclassified Amycolatopsis TaxID=2618356 RepID=UPI00367F2EC4
MTGTTKGLGLGAIVVITAGAVVLSAGSISCQADSGTGANIGADVALTFGPYLVALGLLLGIGAAAAHFAGRARQHR